MDSSHPYPFMIAPNSWLGQRMKLSESMFLSCGPVAGANALLRPPFPLESNQDLPVTVNTRELSSAKKGLVFPRLFPEWTGIVDRLRGTYSEMWRDMGISSLVDLSCQEIEMQAKVLEGALCFWSSHCNSLILPLGLMSITLRDVVALTGLPVLGAEVPSHVECHQFSHVTKEVWGTYSAAIKSLSKKEELGEDEHLIFVWLLLSQWVFEPMAGNPTNEVLDIAKALVSGQRLALGTMLLANTYHRLSVTVSEKPFTKLKGGLWLLQLWLFSYFPDLANDMYHPQSQFVGIDVCRRTSSLSLKVVLRYFRTRVPTSLNTFFLFSEREDSYLPVCARSFFHAKSKQECKWWNAFCVTRKLHHGISKNPSSRAPPTGLVLYAPCLWARQFDFFQAVPGSLPFPTNQERYRASEKEILAALKDAEGAVNNSYGILFLSEDQPLFHLWWPEVYGYCVPTNEASGSSEHELRAPKHVQVKYSDPVSANKRAKSGGALFDQNTRRSGRVHRIGLGFHNSSADPIDMSEDNVATPEYIPGVSPFGKEKLLDVPVTCVYDGDEEEEIQSGEMQDEGQERMNQNKETEAETSKPETDPSEGSFLVYDDGGDHENNQARLNAGVGDKKESSLSDFRSLSSAPTFEFSSMSSDPLPMRPPASQLLPSSSSLNLFLDSHPSQESCLSDIRLEPIELRVGDPFESMNFSFMDGTAPPPSSNLDSVTAAYGTLSAFKEKKMIEWTEVQVDEAVASFFVLISASSDPVKIRTLTEIKDRVVSAFEVCSQKDKRATHLTHQTETGYAEVQKYRERYAKLKEDQKTDIERLERIRVMKARWAELEKELAAVRSECCELMRIGTEFRQGLDRVQIEMNLEESRLANRVTQMHKWHEESRALRQEASKIREEWDSAPRVNISSLLP